METTVLQKPRSKKTKAPQVSDLPASQKLVLHNVRWETYEQMLGDQADVSGLHVYFNNGDLEIMTESFKHAETAELLIYIVTTLADVLEIEFIASGRTTFKREKNKAGFEGDGSFYFQNADAVRGKSKIDLKIDPPPDLVIEVDVTNPSLPKFPIFARLSVGEIWRYDGVEVKFHRLQGKSYKAVAESVNLPGVTSDVVTRLLDANNETKRLQWNKLVRESVGKN